MREIPAGAALLRVICVLAMLRPTLLLAQVPGYFRALTVPPREVGTCIERPPATDSGGRLRTRSRLVIAYRNPSAHRELSLLRDGTGAVVGFNEMVYRSTGLLASVGESVVATLRPDGQVMGYLMHSRTAMSDSGTPHFDTASLRRMRDGAKHSSYRELLDAAAQDKVRVIAQWLAKRCPA